MKIGGKYNWKGQSERLVYLGRKWSGNGYWHQFAKVESPATVWCEVLDSDLHMIEETETPRSDAGLANIPCEGWAADLGCDGIAIQVPGRNVCWKQYCAKCRARAEADHKAWQDRVG